MILWFLTINSRFDANSYIQIIHQEAMKVFGRQYVKSFDDLIDQVLYPIFLRRFSEKESFYKNNMQSKYSKVIRVTTERKCKIHGSDCITALRNLDGLLNKFHRIFSVLNKDLEPSTNGAAV